MINTRDKKDSCLAGYSILGQLGHRIAGYPAARYSFHLRIIEASSCSSGIFQFWIMVIILVIHVANLRFPLESCMTQTGIITKFLIKIVLKFSE